MNYPVDMSPLVRDVLGGRLEDEIAFWAEFEVRRMAARVEHLWFAPQPHARFGYAGFFRVVPVVLGGTRQSQLVANFNLGPMLLFSLPQGPWGGDHDAQLPFAPFFNLMWYANERSTAGPYQLQLFMSDEVRYAMTVTPVMGGESVHLDYGNIDNRTWRYRPRSQRQIRHATYMMNRMPGSWPGPVVRGWYNQLVELGFGRHFVDLMDDDYDPDEILD